MEIFVARNIPCPGQLGVLGFARFGKRFVQVLFFVQNADNWGGSGSHDPIPFCLISWMSAIWLGWMTHYYVPPILFVSKSSLMISEPCSPSLTDSTEIA